MPSMIRKSDQNKSLYYVVCADWESVVEGVDQEDAAASAIEEANNEYGKELCLAPTMVSINLKEVCDDMDVVESTEILYTPTVLANAGMHALSKKYIRTNASATEEPPVSKP